jgi:hypothetical protein
MKQGFRLLQKDKQTPSWKRYRREKVSVKQRLAIQSLLSGYTRRKRNQGSKTSGIKVKPVGRHERRNSKSLVLRRSVAA